MEFDLGYSCIMKRIGSIGIKVLMIISVIIIGTSCTFKDPEVTSFDGIEVIEMKDKRADVELNFTLNNPNRQKLKLKEAELDIFINSIYFGKATLKEAVELPSNGVHPIRLQMVMELDKEVAEMAVALGIAVLMDNLNLKVKGEATGAIGWFRKNIEIDHSEKIKWKDLQKMVE